MGLFLEQLLQTPCRKYKKRDIFTFFLQQIYLLYKLNKCAFDTFVFELICTNIWVYAGISKVEYSNLSTDVQNKLLLKYGKVMCIKHSS